jgi:hypothetical protein
MEGNDYEFHAVDTFMGSEEHKEMLQGQSTYDKYCANLNNLDY